MSTLRPRAFSERSSGALVAALLGATGVLLVWQASLLDLGNVDLPGPGFFPLALGVVITVCSIAIGLDCWRSPAREVIAFGHRDVVVVIVALLAVPLAFEPLGALPTLGLFGAAMLVLVGRVRLPLAIMAATLGMAACWYFFDVLLGLQLPTGPL